MALRTLGLYSKTHLEWVRKQKYGRPKRRKAVEVWKRLHFGKRTWNLKGARNLSIYLSRYIFHSLTIYIYTYVCVCVTYVYIDIEGPL